MQGTGLSIVGCYFHGTEYGILAYRNPSSDIVVEHSEFANNGHGDGQSHNIYVGAVRSFTLRHSYSHHARVGHNVKSRAATSYILYNRLMDERDGISSLILDLPNGGDAFVIGNVMQQGSHGENWSLMAYGAEMRADAAPGRVYIVNNTLVNDRGEGIFIRNPTSGTIRVYNNIFAGPGTLVKGHAVLAGNLIARDFGLLDGVKNVFTNGSQLLEGLEDGGENKVASNPRFVDRELYDYRLLSNSPAVDAAITLESPAAYSLIPVSQYVHPASVEPRPSDGAIDIGAFEAADQPSE
jgi:hypothetical protein